MIIMLSAYQLLAQFIETQFNELLNNQLIGQSIK